MGEIKDLIDAVPKAYAGYLLIFAPTLFCIWLKAEDTYRQFYVISQEHDAIVRVLTTHNYTLLQNQQSLITQGELAWALCMNVADNAPTKMDRCTKANERKLANLQSGGLR